ncbi:hypothetical protein [Streptomyces sp. NPDC057696]|uniref:hypothetical protein n=1 Tax=Streptomyces sp. NPDC057696 TaxID=3346218 RepID=UPI0036C378E0
MSTHMHAADQARIGSFFVLCWIVLRAGSVLLPSLRPAPPPYGDHPGAGGRAMSAVAGLLMVASMGFMPT